MYGSLHIHLCVQMCVLYTCVCLCNFVVEVSKLYMYVLDTEFVDSTNMCVSGH